MVPHVTEQWRLEDINAHGARFTYTLWTSRPTFESHAGGKYLEVGVNVPRAFWHEISSSECFSRWS